ncbi:cytochrome c biogenesis protein ResB [Streptomyces gamaensis]|uniref:Cytochrome c biogenesis protein ResB n=1 Tax=Streptomyces gamaensis TaxID=1763542 RepID=A0ABW0Z4M3_9ACTN
MANTDTSAGKTGAEETDAREGDLASAGERLSTAPAEDSGQAVPGSFGGVRRPGALGALAWTAREALGWARWFWRQLTSMRVALILLFLLSLGAVPGSLIPQTSTDSVKADEWKRAHETLTPLYEKLGLFHVYSSVWFSAIYILLFVSLIGCIVPRTWQFLGQLRGRPPAAPRRLTRLPAYASWHTDAAPEQVLAAAGKLLGRRRYRVAPGEGSVAAEKGYLREAGNLLFHLSLLVMLVAFASGQLWKSEGGTLVVEGGSFANALPQYDDFKSGSLFSAEDLGPFRFTLNSFDESYERTGPQRGTARTFRANVTYWEGDAEGAGKKTAIEVNHPLEVQGAKVYLIGHGYAPVVTVKDGRGTVVYQGPVPFLPQDSEGTMTGVIKVPDARGKDGASQGLGFQGLFTSTYALDPVRGPHSSFPALDYPVLSLNAFYGDLGMNSGLPQNVYKLDTQRMKQFKSENGDLLRSALRPGETLTLPDGAGSLSFDGIKAWASFQVSQQPGNTTALIGAVGALVGVAGSLFIQRRRVWVRAVAGKDGRTVVELAGLGRSESARLPEELAGLAAALEPDAPPAGPPSTDSADPSEGARA